MAVLGCSEQQTTDAPTSLRDTAVVLGGTTRFDAARFAGDWQTVRCLGSCAAAARFVNAADGVVVREVGEQQTAFTVGGPGVLRERDGGQTLVVMWVDEGFRTAAIGDAQGRWAAIIDRGAGAPDRVAAAREILDFNGWDISQLRKSDT